MDDSVAFILLESKYVHHNYKFNHEDDFYDFQSFDKQDYLDRINYETHAFTKRCSSDHNLKVDQSLETAPQVYFLREIIKNPNANSILGLAPFYKPSHFEINNDYGYAFISKKPVKRDYFNQHKTVTRYIKLFRTTPTVQSTAIRISPAKVKNNLENKHFKYKMYGIHKKKTSIDDSCNEIECYPSFTVKTTRCKTMLHPFKSCGSSTKNAILLKNSIFTSTTKKPRTTTVTTEKCSHTTKKIKKMKSETTEQQHSIERCSKLVVTRKTITQPVITTKKETEMESETIEDQDLMERCSKFAVMEGNSTQPITTTKKQTKMKSEATEEQDSIEECSQFAVTKVTTNKLTCETVLEHLQKICPSWETTKKHLKWPHIHINNTTQILKCTNYYGMILCPNCGKKVRYNMQIIRNKPKKTTTSEHYEFVY